MDSNLSILHNNYKKKRVETLVAMAVYGGDKVEWVEQAIDSILNQTYQDFVFIIVIDGEITVKMMNKLKDKAFSDHRIILAQNVVKPGLASCMNKAAEWGLSLNPSYFVRMDADDISISTRLARQINYLRKHAYISVLGSALTEINEHGGKVGARVMPSSHRQIVSILPRRCSLNHPTVVIRYTVFEQGYRYDSNLMNTQDYFLWVTLASNGFVFRNLKDRLLNFRRVNNFYKRRGFSKSLNEFRARFNAMLKLKKLTPYNAAYACGVLALRLMPGKVVKLAYKLDRHLLDRFGKH
ncbi:glycosyltransferase [Alteromonas sp. K632G]|uniref:glycosyltransferase n=1 Tax=Alteromonas sp. K632G TaxID=2820757 RepID=UPI000C0E6279|nr:glycosyltransferase [Alteromonas sp. K632G]MBO7920655.1 glycosyltransferase [Alteromonas sp. K632G]PHS42947.1 MAG: glycosyl transferase [Alteromonas sp.]